MPDAEIRKLPQTSDFAASEARMQADAYNSLFAERELKLDDGSVLKVPAHPEYGMIDDDRLEEYEELLFEMDTLYDREEDIYIREQHLRDATTGELTGATVPATTQRGALKRPYRINGALVRPPHSVKIVMTALGKSEYERLRAGGGSAKDVWRVWNEQNMEIRERQAVDSKSNASAVDLAAVPKADSQ